MDDETRRRQVDLCREHDADFMPVDLHDKVGISRSVRTGGMPIHGMRIAPGGGTTGWYIWAGEYSEDPDFFVPLHVSHLPDWCPLVERFLALPPGWRFLTDGVYSDVWKDDQLLA